MRKSIKTLLALFVLLFTLQFSLTVSATTIPTATNDFYVNDFAEIFSEAEKNRLIENAVALADEHDGIQVVVTTVTSLEGNTVENYAFKMYNEYGIGKNDMGILILLSTGDRQIRVEVGKAMEAYINDSKAGKLMDNYAIPYLKENKFNEGLISLQEALISEIIDCVQTDIVETPAISSTSGPISKENTKNNSRILIFLFFLIVMIILLSTIFICWLNGNNKKLKKQMEELKKVYDSKLEKVHADAYSELSSVRRKYEERLDIAISERNRIDVTYETQLTNMGARIQNLNSTLSATQKEFSALQEKYSRVIKLYPNIENEIDIMIQQEKREYDMEQAAKVDMLLKNFIGVSPNKDIVSKVQNALCAYSSLEAQQKPYITTDIIRIEQLYNASKKLKTEYETKLKIEADQKEAHELELDISQATSNISVAVSADLDKLDNLTHRYNNMTSSAKTYFDKTVADKLDQLLQQAQYDRNIENKVKSAEESINSVLRHLSFGRASDLDELLRAKSFYENLSSEARNRFDKSILNKLENLIEEAKRDKKRKEEERERKRREEESRRRNNHSNLGGGFGGHSGGGFSGFGGHSGGGGASRGF